MKNKFSKKKKILLSATVAILLLLGSWFLTIAEEFCLFSWEDIFYISALNDISYQAKNYDMSVHVIDVGKADSIYIKCKDKHILIDAGERDIYDKVNVYLRKNNVKKLDLVISTHPHSDHIGGMRSVLDEFTVDRFIMPVLPENILPTSKTYEKLLLKLDEKNINVEKPVSGSSFNIGELKIDVLAPNNDYDKVNNYSVVVKATYKNKRFLLVGDAEKESEQDILKKGFDLSADVLKVGHHGSKTSTTKEFLEKINPTYAVISVAEDKSKLPKREIINRLNYKGYIVYRTDINGTVIFLTNGDTIDVVTEK